MFYKYAGIMCIKDFLKCISESVKILQSLCGQLNLSSVWPTEIVFLKGSFYLIKLMYC